MLFLKVNFDDASPLLARVSIFLQNVTPFSFSTNQKSVFGVRQSVVISVSTSDPNVPPEAFEGSKTAFDDVLKF